MLIPLLIGMSFLTACEKASSEGPSCPREKTYSKEFQIRLADALDPLPAGSPIVSAMLDYIDLRGQAKACRGE